MKSYFYLVLVYEDGAFTRTIGLCVKSDSILKANLCVTVDIVNSNLRTGNEYRLHIACLMGVRQIGEKLA